MTTESDHQVHEIVQEIENLFFLILFSKIAQISREVKIDPHHQYGDNASSINSPATVVKVKLRRDEIFSADELDEIKDNPYVLDLLRFKNAIKELKAGSGSVPSRPRYFDAAQIVEEVQRNAAETGKNVVWEAFAAVAHVFILASFSPQYASSYRALVTFDTFGNRDRTRFYREAVKAARKEVPTAYPDEIRAGLVFAAHVSLEPRCASDDSAPLRSDGLAFERACLSQLQNIGFEAALTARQGDYGADIIAEKNGWSYAVQCKDQNRPAGLSAVQEVVAAKNYYSLNYAIVISKSGFSSAAVALANRNAVILLSNQDISRLETFANELIVQGRSTAP